MPVPTFTATTLRAATRPTFYFIGVTTGSSSIQRVFPAWAAELGLDAQLMGIDLPLHAPAEDYRRVVEFIRDDPLSLGALVTTHKIDLYRATADLFDERDWFSQLMGETSCISKKDGRLCCHAKDPISSGLALDAFIPAGYWASHPEASVLCLGAGGSTIAVSWFLSQKRDAAQHHLPAVAQAEPAATADTLADDRPARIIVTNRSQPRLDHLREVHAQMNTDLGFDYVLSPTPADNDAVVGALPPWSLVVNATGLGKDAPGSPVTGAAEFPLDGLAWDLNYRGDLVFLDQARAQQASRRLTVEDGWVYFLHGWTRVVAEVFHIDIPTSGAGFDRLSDLAKDAR